ncbi:ATP-dependent protease subunit HslV [Rickettsiales bacterium]|nr:ATP-dependent protease subunit HslV [Rickettsiales bacterium]
MSNQMYATTVMCVRKEGKVIMASDGQVTLGDMICKSNVNKVRSLDDGRVLAGFAGSVADSLILVSELEDTLRQYPNDLTRAVIELSKKWRGDRSFQRLDTSIVIANKDKILCVGGNGEVVEIEDEIVSIGSGSKFALAAGYALIYEEKLSAEDIVKKSMNIAAKLCVYTNEHLNIISL